MSTNGQPSSGAPARYEKSARPTKGAAAAEGKPELKILMLHGYTQTGAIFDNKTRALTKKLKKVLPASVSLIFADGPLKLRPSEIPGYGGDDASDDDDPDDGDGAYRAWFRKDEATGELRGFEAGMDAVASAIRAAGPGGVDGVLGFSQGAAVAALVASALEVPHRAPPADAPSPSSLSSPADWGWVARLRDANAGRPLRFFVSYSGFPLEAAGLRWLYEEPRIATPSLQVLGSLDTVVEEGRCRGLVERSVDPTVVVHPGGHYVPVARDWMAALVNWLTKRCEDMAAANSKEENA
ncbi:serine hydrolase FSH [Xylariaceae sp. FL0662B]|nr:serine hydrolase FSH [Xylariaceae sp. FL0662B]